MKTSSYVLFALACLPVVGCGENFSQRIAIPRPLIQKTVNGWFPLSTDSFSEVDLPVRVTLSDPIVIFNEASDQCGLEIKITAQLPRPDIPRLGSPAAELPASRGDTPFNPDPAQRVIEGKVAVLFGLEYDSSDGTFYCTNPNIRELSFDSLPDRFDEPVRRGTELLLKEYLSRNSVYTLRDDEMTTSAAKAVLKSVSVKNGELYVEIGI